MRQIFYVSDSLIGLDRDQLDCLMMQSMRRNGLIGITGLLWTDGERFAQILEGDEDNIDATMLRIQSDARHTDVRMVVADTIGARHFGGWAMYRPVSDPLGARLDSAAVGKLSTIQTAAAVAFIDVVLISVDPVALGKGASSALS